MYQCRCCGHDTIPMPPNEAVAYICPICWWENDVFTCDDNEPSDENHGLSLNQGRANYREYGICDPRLQMPRGRAYADEDFDSCTASDQIIGGCHTSPSNENHHTGDVK